MKTRSKLKDWVFLIIRRDLLLSFRKATTYLTPLIFFLIVITFFPLALGPSQQLLSFISPGVLWIAVLLASLLAIESIFNEDFKDGTLDQIVISGEPLFILIFAKVFASWFVTGAPILIASFIGAIFLYLPEGILLPLLSSLLLGSLIMSFLGALGGALSLGKSAILSAIIVLPLSVPVLLLGSATLSSAINHQDFSAYLFFMGALLAISIPILSLVIVEAILLNYE